MINKHLYLQSGSGQSSASLFVFFPGVAKQRDAADGQQHQQQFQGQQAFPGRILGDVSVASREESAQEEEEEEEEEEEVEDEEMERDEEKVVKG